MEETRKDVKLKIVRKMLVHGDKYVEIHRITGFSLHDISVMARAWGLQRYRKESIS